jgi:hypothetical protein
LRSNRTRIEVNAELRQRLEELLGPGHFGLLTTRPPPSSAKPSRGRRGAMQPA